MLLLKKKTLVPEMQLQKFSIISSVQGFFFCCCMSRSGLPWCVLQDVQDMARSPPASMALSSCLFQQ